MNNPITVTPTQDDYLKRLASEPQTTRDFALSMMVSMRSAGKMIKRLRDAGLVKSSKLRGAHGNVHIHELTAPYSELDIILRRNSTGITIPDAEIHYAAKLRNSGLVGQRLTEAHHGRYPGRAESTVRGMVTTAKARGLCR